MIEIIGNRNESEHRTLREPPLWFKDKLRQFDRTLNVSWNKRKERWVIEECVEHHGDGDGRHTYLCRRDPFFLLQEEDGSQIYLEDSRIFDHFLLKFNIERRYGGIDGVIEKMNDIDRANEAKEIRLTKEHVQNQKKDNKRQLNEAMDLIDRHNIWEVH